MAQVRFVGPPNPVVVGEGKDQRTEDAGHEIPLLGRTVQSGELVEVPDEWLTEYTWPEASWQVDQPAPKRAPKDKG